LEYLTQLLGENNHETLAFVEDMGRYRRGETIGRQVKDDGDTSGRSERATTQSSTASIKPAKTMQEDIGIVARAASDSKENKAQNLRNNQKKTKSRVPPPKTKINTAVASSKSSRNGTSTESVDPISSTTELRTQPTTTTITTKDEEDSMMDIARKFSSHPPPKGIPKIICGCYGTYHKALTNCLYCGRISCEAEGYDFCAFCGYLIEDVRDGKEYVHLHHLSSQDSTIPLTHERFFFSSFPLNHFHSHSKDPHWERKERLLRFDREFARRTEIIDDQGDYQGPSMWMNDKERADAEENQAQRLDALKRPPRVMNLAV